MIQREAKARAKAIADAGGGRWPLASLLSALTSLCPKALSSACSSKAFASISVFLAMAHAATMLAWAYGETPAVLSSIGPGPLLAYAGSLAAASNGIGVYHIYGDETTTCSKSSDRIRASSGA